MATLPQKPVLPKEEQQKAIAAEIAAEKNSDVFFFAGSINSQSSFAFTNTVHANRKQENAILFLSTFGGDADAAFRMARCLQFSYPKGKISLYVNMFCKSAGTLMALGASELVMSATSELGPLDVQISKADTLGERTSGLTPTQSLATLREESFNSFEKCFLELIQRSGRKITLRTASRIAVQLTVGLFKPIFAQIDPMTLGEYQRSLLIAEMYGKLLNIYGNLKIGALDKLIAGYPSHGFIIDFAEATSLFQNLRGPNEKELALAVSLLDDVTVAMSNPNPEALASVKYLSQAKKKEDSHERIPATENGRPTPPTGTTGGETATHSPRSQSETLRGRKQRLPRTRQIAGSNEERIHPDQAEK